MSEKTIDDYFRDWENHVFGFNSVVGEKDVHIF
jgi:hypothetical protein